MPTKIEVLPVQSPLDPLPPIIKPPVIIVIVCVFEISNCLFFAIDNVPFTTIPENVVGNCKNVEDGLAMPGSKVTIPFIIKFPDVLFPPEEHKVVSCNEVVIVIGPVKVQSAFACNKLPSTIKADNTKVLKLKNN